MIVEVAILAPVILLAFLFVGWVGAQRDAEASAMFAARSAARAAALAANPASAVSAGTDAGTNAANDSACSSMSITVEISQWDDGWVTATATCAPGSNASTFTTGPIVRDWIEPVGQRSRVGR